MARRVFISLVLLLSSVLALAQFRTITVQNANSNPVPTTIQNTPNVNIANTPNVNATISGTPAVNVTNTPAVTISGTPAVSVTNLPTGTAGPGNITGLAVKNLDEPGRQPFQHTFGCSVPAAASKCTDDFTVPAGERLVIEYLVIFSADSGASTTLEYSLKTQVQNATGIYAYFPGPAVAGSNHTSEHLVRIYADPGTVVEFTGFQNNTASGVVFSAIFSGYFVAAQ